MIEIKCISHFTLCILKGNHFYISGAATCLISALIRIPLFTIENFLTTCMSCYRLYVLRSMIPNTKKLHVYVVIVVVWIFSTLYVFSLIIWGNIVVFFNPIALGCSFTVLERSWKRIKLYFGVTVAFLGTVIIIITNVWTLIIASRRQGSWKGASKSAFIMVGSICLTFAFSWVPFLVFWACMLSKVQLPKSWPIVAEHALDTNAVINPLIYTATNKSFRGFIKYHIFR